MKSKLMLVLTLIFIICFTGGFTDQPKAKKGNIVKNQKKFSRGMVMKKAYEPPKTYYSSKAVVLTYHHISKDCSGPISITPDRFESDLNMLVYNGFNVISLRAMLNAIDGKEKLPDNAVVITFDDGIGSFYKYAYPKLKDYNMPATEFLITTRTQNYKATNGEFQPLSPEEITEMSKSGLIDFQSHTHNSHEKVNINPQLKQGPKLTNKIYDKTSNTYESESSYENRVIEDLTKSSQLIKQYTGHSSDVLCFPYGIFNNKSIELAQKCGYKYFVTTLVGANKQSSGNNKIFRIRAGDHELNSDKLLQNIISAGQNGKID